MAEWRDDKVGKSPLFLKRRRTADCPPQPLNIPLKERRELLKKWVKHAKIGSHIKWETLRKLAGLNHVNLADTLFEWLHKNGWISVTQEFKNGMWQPQQVEFLHQPKLRIELGLRDPNVDAQCWREIRTALHALENDALLPAVLALDDMTVQRALARQDLIFKLNDWQVQQQSGTHRNFAWFARGDSKAIKDTELDWLESLVDLAEFGIERHTPLLLIAAPLTLTLPRGQLDLAALPDFAALTPATVQAAVAASGKVSRWQLVENRTSFENVAKKREADTGIIWLPGFPPSWWKEAVGQLLDLAPAPAHIACDPDPAGIAIALQAAELWRERGLAWLPWKMSAANLAGLRARKALTAGDKLQLASLRQAPSLPDALGELLEWMLEHEEKGEQEGYL